MSIRRRLFNLECRPFKRPIPQQDDEPGLAAALRRLNLPLPDQVTAAEKAHALELFRDGVERIKIDRGDTATLDALSEYARGLHDKYV